MTSIGKHDASLMTYASLVDPLRRGLFRYVASARDPVGRDEAATALGVSRSVAAFQLDKLANAGLLVVEFRRLHGRTGPGAGRPAKLYRAVRRELAFSVPERRYEVAAAVLAQAVADADAKAIPVTDALRMAARTFGRAMGAAAQGSRGDGRRESLERIAAVLVSYGYEPRIGPGDMNLVNCPYGALAAEHREVICSMNLRLLRGVLKGAEEKDLSARRENQPGHCCVTIRVR